MLRIDTPIVTEQVNCWEVRGLELLMPPDEPPTMIVRLASGYEDGGVVTWGREQLLTVPPSALMAAWSSPIESASLYVAVQASLYAWLKQAGHIPMHAIEVG
jgi:hypothetical protein